MIKTCIGALELNRVDAELTRRKQLASRPSALPEKVEGFVPKVGDWVETTWGTGTRAVGRVRDVLQSRDPMVRCDDVSGDKFAEWQNFASMLRPWQPQPGEWCEGEALLVRGDVLSGPFMKRRGDDGAELLDHASPPRPWVARFSTLRPASPPENRIAQPEAVVPCKHERVFPGGTCVACGHPVSTGPLVYAIPRSRESDTEAAERRERVEAARASLGHCVEMKEKMRRKDPDLRGRYLMDPASDTNGLLPRHVAYNNSEHRAVADDRALAAVAEARRISAAQSRNRDGGERKHPANWDVDGVDYVIGGA